MELDTAILSVILNEALRGGEYADAFVERRSTCSARLQEGRIHEVGTSLITGVGIRVISGEQTGFAYSDDLSVEALREAARVAALIARDPVARTRSVEIPSFAELAPSVYREDDGTEPFADVKAQVDLLARADIAARAADPRVREVNASLVHEVQEVLIATSDGRLLRDRRPLVRFAVQCVAHGSERGTGYEGDGGRAGLSFYSGEIPERIAQEAARIACVNSEASDAPAGELPVIIGPGGGGVLLHEAVGHGLEGDFNRQGTSAYSGRIGQLVASELVTIHDDGNLVGERGSVAIDDEGNPGRSNVLIENGVLQGYLFDQLNAGLMSRSSTGSGRRQSFRHVPQARMSNTYMVSGASAPEDIIASVERGIYARSFLGGQVEISKGDFVFMVAEGYMIENGKLTRPIRGATLIGNGPKAMTRIVAVGNDSKLAGGSGTCGKRGQQVPVGVGMPTVKISGMTVGGSSLG
ncbi:MAG TPA: metallopeptidase TldD-related protein [Candidatus Baltobacteraceae bacterium]|nr:metallopeptidase TldD-related protein [Candidatus Baltobacteraceae bacterium]